MPQCPAVIYAALHDYFVASTWYRYLLRVFEWRWFWHIFLFEICELPTAAPGSDTPKGFVQINLHPKLVERLFRDSPYILPKSWSNIVARHCIKGTTKTTYELNLYTIVILCMLLVFYLLLHTYIITVILLKSMYTLRYTYIVLQFWFL